MFDERFDKILKQNLESVKPAYQPQAWDRFSKRLPATGFWPFVQQYGGWVLCGLMMAGWVTTLYTLKENQEIIRQISSAQNRAALPKGGSDPISKMELTSSSAAQKTDTVYIVRKTIVEHRHYTLGPNWTKKTSKGSNQAEKQAMPVISDAEISADNSSQPGSDRGAEQTNKTQLSQPNEEKSSGNESKEVLKQYALGLSLDSSQNGNSLVNTAKTDSIGKGVDKETVIALIDSAWAKQSVKQRLRTAYGDSLAQRPPYALERDASTKPKRPPFSLSSIQPRFGIETILSRYSHGFGPTIELFPTENLGVSFGLQASTLRAENHKALRDYNSATGKLFLVQYRSYLPMRFDRISDISIKTSVISLPVNLKYYIPLKNDLSLFVQSGTSLDLSAYQQVNFESHLNQSKRRNTFEMDAKPNLFHDFMIGTGVQYRRARILAQVSPYYVYDFRSMENTPAGSNFGLKASLWVNLYK